MEVGEEMNEMYERTGMVIGSAAVEKLRSSHVAVFGIGGVGGHAAEALVRAGIGEITVIDRDEVSKTNINRQIIALNSTVGRLKTEVMGERLRDISPEVKVHEYPVFFLPENSDDFDFSAFDYVCDCVDTVTAKLEIIMKCREKGVPIISSMGTGYKLYPEKLDIMDIYETKNCPLAKVMRKELKKRGVDRLTTVASYEMPVSAASERSRLPGSMSFVPSAAGLMMAGYVIRSLIGV